MALRALGSVLCHDTVQVMPRRMLIGGHRGVGENLWRESEGSVAPAYRENTIKSFLRAEKLGVDFVEFDVQVTSDGIPVIWHDDSVVQSRVHDEDGGGAASTATTTTTTSLAVADMPLQRFKEVVDVAVPEAGGTGQQPSSSSSRLQLVRQFRGLQSRAAVPGGPLPWVCSEEDTLPTLAEVFVALPRGCGYDVEIKMTGGPDIERTPPVEVARVVDAIWDVVHRQWGEVAAPEDEAGGGGGGDLFFSSFDPDVCEAMALKQQRYRVWYLSGCGLYPHVDTRRTSITAALAFASGLHLAGVVLPAQVLLANEGMVAQASALALGLMTYGLENDGGAAIERQRLLGVQGAIVDDVQALMAKSLS